MYEITDTHLHSCAQLLDACSIIRQSVVLRSCTRHSTREKETAKVGPNLGDQCMRKPPVPIAEVLHGLDSAKF